MNLHGFFAILYTVLYIFDICDSQCDEYIILFEEYSCGKSYNLKATTINNIIWESLTYPYNTTEVREEIQGYRECILEFDCVGSVGSCFDVIVPKTHSTHADIPNNKSEEYHEEKTSNEKIVKSNKPIGTVGGEFNNSMMDINIMYINDNTSAFTGNKNQITCEYAEISCINEQLDNISISYTEHVINKTLHHETPSNLYITILRDLNSAIQPIFTGYFSQLKPTEDNFKEQKVVTFTCELIENYNCRENISKKSSKHINVYMKTNYIQNITVKYPNCTKDTSDSLNLTCNSKNFARTNPHLSAASKFISENSHESNNKTSQEVFTFGAKDLLICKCQITSDFKINDSNVISFNNCSNHRNIINGSKSKDLNITTTVVNKTRNINNGTEVIDKLNKLENSIQKTEQSNSLSSINENNIITIRITENGYNCSHESLNGIDVGKIILNNDLKERNTKKNILENKNVVLNISNCININASVLKNTETKTELAIVLQNSSLNSFELFATDPEEAGLKQKIILQCNRPNFNTNSSNVNINKIILKCEFINLEGINDKTFMENKNTKKLNANKINAKNTLDETDAKDEHNYTNNNNSTRNDNSTKSVNNKGIGNDAISKGNPQMNTFNRKKDMKSSLEQNNLGPERNGPEKILIIIMASVAGGSLLVIFTLQRCTKKASYRPAPTREAPLASDEEDTAL